MDYTEFPKSPGNPNNIPKKRQYRSKNPSDTAICTQINEMLQSIHTNHQEVIHAFVEMFGSFQIRHRESAAAYYFLTIVFENQKFKFLDNSRHHDKEVKISPSLKKFEDISTKLFNNKFITRATLESVQNQFLEKGIVARILFTKNNKPYENRFERFFPINPVTLWNTIPASIRGNHSHYDKIMNTFDQLLYQKKFGKTSELLKGNYNILNFNTKWFIYMLLTHEKKDSVISMQLSNIKSDKNDPNDFLEKLLNKETKIIALLDQRGNDQIKRARELKNNYPKFFEVKYTKEELKGTSRRIILDDVFAADMIKILSPTNEKNTDGAYVGVLYSDENINHFKDSFSIWYKQGIDLDEIEN